MFNTYIMHFISNVHSKIMIYISALEVRQKKKL